MDSSQGGDNDSCNDSWVFESLADINEVLSPQDIDSGDAGNPENNLNQNDAISTDYQARPFLTNLSGTEGPTPYSSPANLTLPFSQIPIRRSMKVHRRDRRRKQWRETEEDDRSFVSIIQTVDDTVSSTNPEDFKDFEDFNNNSFIDNDSPEDGPPPLPRPITDDEPPQPRIPAWITALYNLDCLSAESETTIDDGSTPRMSLAPFPLKQCFKYLLLGFVLLGIVYIFLYVWAALGLPDFGLNLDYFNETLCCKGKGLSSPAESDNNDRVVPKSRFKELPSMRAHPNSVFTRFLNMIVYILT